jgi:hypothetical protein
MSFRKERFIEPEVLDDQTPERAAPSLRDIVKINRLTGGHRVLREALAACMEPGAAFSMLDVGAASGDTAALVRTLFPRATVVSLDYRSHHLAGAPGDRVAADAFRLPFPPRSFDVVYCGLFLHHFNNDAVVQLLHSFGEIARRNVIVNDLERHILPWYFLPATKWIFGWDSLTLHDGPISVQAAFTGPELRHLGECAGLQSCRVRVYRPAFRLCLIAGPAT